MTTRLGRLFARTEGARRWRFAVLLAAVVAVPLAIAGFFAGSLAGASHRSNDVPALVVNDDTMVTTTTADGAKQPVLAGRQLVTELTKPSSDGFRWAVSNAKDAKKALEAGQAQAVLTIPKDFSHSVVSLSGSSPQRADLAIATDDAHSYLAGSIAQSVGNAMTASFGRAITQQYVEGLLSGVSGLGGALSTASGGASRLADGSGQLATGLDSLTSGAQSAAGGAAQLSAGVDSYTSGVDSLAAGLDQLSAGAQDASQLTSGVSQYVQASQGLASAVQQLAQVDPGAAALLADPGVSAAVAGIQGGGQTLVDQTGSAIGGVQSGIAQAKSGADQLSAGSQGLRDGASGVASGVQQLAGGAAQSASGAHGLQTGAQGLADGLAKGAAQAPTTSAAQAKKAADVIADPVSTHITRHNELSSPAQLIGMLLLPVGLWIGALATFLLLRPASKQALASTASTGRIVTRGLVRAAGIAVGQAVLVTVLLHTTLAVPWHLLPATLAFAVLVALVFTGVHQLLMTAFRRVGVMVSILLLALQVAVVPGLLPAQLIGQPFQAIAAALPMTYAVSGMQALVSGVGGVAVAAPAIVLILFGFAALLVTLIVVTRRRGARSFAFTS